MQQQLAHYQINERLGEGSFATVYRAFDQKFEREVALKVLKRVWQSDPQAVQRFDREAKTIARLRHPHIVDVYDVGQAEGQLYLAQLLVQGETLAARLKRGRLTWSEMLAVVQPLASALDYAHGQGIIHRDLKPANILLDQNGTVFLGDFGLVRAAEGSTALSTSAGGMIGTPAYMAPEQWQGRPATAATDVYALSCIVVEMLTGRVLFDGSTPAVAVYQHTVEGPKLPSHWPAEAPAGLGQVLAQALAREPADRYPTAGALAQALAELGQVQPVAPLPAPPRSTPASKFEPVARPPQPRSSGWLWLGGVVGVIVLSIIGFSALGGGARPTPETVYIVETVVVEKEKVVTSEAEPEVEPSVTVMAEANAPANTPQPPTRTPTFTPALPTNTPQPPTPTPAPQLGLGSTGRREADGMTMVYVPAGSFTMGSGESDSLADDDEKPAHRVTLDAFWLDQTEVPVAMFRQFVEATGYETTAEKEGSGWVYSSSEDNWTLTDGANWQHPSGPNSEADGNHPVVQVSWEDAKEYCEWAGGRLPTEAEWEYAARGPESLIYPWGNEFDGAKLNYCDTNCGRKDWKDETVDDGYPFTAPVGSYPAGASWVGALDLAGNVWEWVADWYGTYPATAQTNPTGPDSGGTRVLRGGGWYSYERYVRAANRDHYVPNFRLVIYGFRCVGSPGN